MARIAVSGAGWWGQGWHLPHLSRHPDAMIAAIVEPNPSPVSSNAAQVLESTAQLSSRYSAPVYGSVGELLASTTELDGLLVGSPHASHFADGMLAIEAGVHVLMEKPMTTSVDEARALAAAAHAHTDAGRFFAVNNTANWRPATRIASAAVAAGRLGQVQHVAARMHSPLLWLFDEPANAGWVAPTGDMVGNGFGWGQLSHLLAWCFEVSGLQPEAAFTSMQHSARTGADLHVAAVVTCVGGGLLREQRQLPRVEGARHVGQVPRAVVRALQQVVEGVHAAERGDLLLVVHELVHLHRCQDEAGRQRQRRRRVARAHTVARRCCEGGRRCCRRQVATHHPHGDRSDGLREEQCHVVA